MSNTVKLGLPLLYENQSQKSVTINSSLTSLDRIVQMTVVSRTSTTPTSPIDGQAHIVLTGATGTWATRINNIAVWNATTSAWNFLVPYDGWRTWVSNETLMYIYSSGLWVPLLQIQTYLDQIGSTQGDILYRDATDWVVLSPGASGTFLRSNGVASNPTWVTWASQQIITTGTFTLTPSATSTVVTDATCTSSSVVLPRATTANAAADLDLMYIVEGSGTFTVHHANNALTNRTFKYVRV
jgi:hypothetical protein